MYVITYLEDGTITSIGRIEMESPPKQCENGFLYLAEFPFELPISFKDYKVRDSTVVYDPVQEKSEENEEEEITYG